MPLPESDPRPMATARIAKRFAPLRAGVIHYRVAGSGPPVVLLHDSPRSSRLHEATMLALADRFTVFALDTPGYGNATPLALPRPTIADFAAALSEALDVLGLAGVPIYATHTSAKIALEHAATFASPPTLLLLDGLSMPRTLADEAFVAAYMRPFRIDATGAYLAAEWTRLRDMLRWFPWFDTRPDTRIPMAAPGEAWLHAYAIDLLSAGPHYADAYAAAMRYDPRAALARVTSPVIVAAHADDVLYPYLAEVPAAASATVAVRPLSADRGEWLAWLGDALAGAAHGRAPGAAATDGSRDRPVYHDLPHGQMLVHHDGGGGRPLLILETPTLLHARQWQAAVAPYRPTLLPELPGYGESDPLPDGTVADHADALAAMLRQAGQGAVDVLGIGFAGPLAAALAARHPDLVASLILDGLPAWTGAQAADCAARLCPVFAPDPGGSHLHRIWHMLRDGEAQWPWYDDDVAATRRLAPVLDGEALHADLLGILKQPKHFGDAATAGLAAAAIDIATLPVSVLLFDHPDDPGYRGVAAMAGAHAGIVTIPRPATIAAAAVDVLFHLDGQAHGPRDAVAAAH